MGKYLDLLEQAGLYERNEVNEKTRSLGCAERGGHNSGNTFFRLLRFFRTFSALEIRCPDLVPIDRWQQAVEDGRRFLTRWGEQAEALGWTSKDLFGLHWPPAVPHPSYSRLSRYDETGLVWLLCGREVIALTEATAAIQGTTGVTVYRKHNKPALGPVGDSLDDFEPPFGGNAA